MQSPIRDSGGKSTLIISGDNEKKGLFFNSPVFV